jgi:hypothetical protein
MHHADLDGAKAAATGEYKGRPCRPGMVEWGQSHARSVVGAPAEVARVRALITGEKRAAPSTKVGRHSQLRNCAAEDAHLGAGPNATSRSKLWIG